MMESGKTAAQLDGLFTKTEENASLAKHTAHAAAHAAAEITVDSHAQIPQLSQGIIDSANANEREHHHHHHHHNRHAHHKDSGRKDKKKKKTKKVSVPV